MNPNFDLIGRSLPAAPAATKAAFEIVDLRAGMCGQLRRTQRALIAARTINAKPLPHRGQVAGGHVDLCCRSPRASPRSTLLPGHPAARR